MENEKPIEIKDLKPGSYVIIDGEPCRVTKISKSKPGKHGSAKARIEAVGIFDGRKHSLLKPASAMVTAPIILKKTAQVISVGSDSVQLMDLEDYSMFEAAIPDEFRGKLQPGGEIEYWKIAGRIMIKNVKK